MVRPAERQIAQEVMMARQIGTSTEHRSRSGLASLSGLVAGITVTATLVVGVVSGAAAAPDRRAAWDHHDRDSHRGWVGGYYRQPPVVYGYRPYAPPLVYAPPPGLSINIR